MRYSEQFSFDEAPAVRPPAHTVAGEKLPSNGTAQPEMPSKGMMRAAYQAMPIGLSYDAGHDFGPYTQHCGEGLPPIFSLQFDSGAPYSAGNIHPHTGLLLFALALNQRPETVIETGTFYGYSTHFLAEALRLWDDGGIVHTIDPNMSHVVQRVREHPCVQLHQGLSYRVLPELMKELGEVQFAFLDSYKRIAAYELQLIHPYMAPRGIVVFHDTQFLNTGRTLCEVLDASAAGEHYETMFFAGTPHRENAHRFFGNADDRGLLVLRRRDELKFLDVADHASAIYGDSQIRGDS